MSSEKKECETNDINRRQFLVTGADAIKFLDIPYVATRPKV
jgi:hypothetical protein